MHFTSHLSLLLATSATLIAAQDASSSSNSHCASQKLVDYCVTAMKKGLNECTSGDWDCKCSGAANIANCYVDCSDEDPDRAEAQNLSMNNCATANAYDQGLTTVAPTWTRPGSNAAQPTDTDFTLATGSGTSPTASPTKSLKGNEKAASPSEGAAPAPMKATGGWLALVGLGLGIAI
ncbi:uncharacterized protein N7515_007438 [Penicillium bovifimosum]|uniref:Extracellular membrane protein CFEM domain-containing protein n=1 Tax=Penicillium bovifimosum TaxID=126998 RepID=A0A9W9GWM3_9EURO|nr:uncharacterized protein N7515_007438 [Penicillium bovifimosum]KAJ5131399.1 hypothetical protein N7515_007438 [Penicillium bovifimosum]